MKHNSIIIAVVVLVLGTSVFFLTRNKPVPSVVSTEKTPGTITTTTVPKASTTPQNIVMGTVAGSVTLSPVCPVERMPPDPGCAPKPYQTDIKVLSADGNRLIKTVHNKADGSFAFDLPFGRYVLEPVGGKMFPRCESVPLEVAHISATSVALSCDTGIR